MARRYWIAVVSKDHVQNGVKGGFMQACHGKKQPLSRMKKGDGFLFYSGKNTMNSDDKCQCFTAIGEVKDDEIYPFLMHENFVPFRRDIHYFESNEVAIASLIENLDFISDKKKWGYYFRFGFLEIGEKDFNFIQSKMRIYE